MFPLFALPLKPVGLTDNMEVATGAGPAIPEPYTDVQAPAEQTAPVVHLGGREVRVLTAFNSSTQLSVADFCLNFTRSPVPSSANQYLVSAATLTAGTGMVFHAAFWNVLELPPVRRASLDRTLK